MTANVSLIEKQPLALVGLARQLLTKQVLAYLPDHWQPYENDKQALQWLTDQAANLFEIQYHNQACGLMIVHSQDQTWYLGFMLLPSFWGKGIAANAVKAVQDLANQQEITTIIAGAHIDNIASLRVLQKCHFKITTEAQQAQATWHLHN